MAEEVVGQAAKEAVLPNYRQRIDELSVEVGEERQKVALRIMPYALRITLRHALHFPSIGRFWRKFSANWTSS